MSRVAEGPTIAFRPGGVEIPPGISDLGRFRAWVRSDAFPEVGRIDWVGGRLEIDMSPEDLNTHATPKAAIVAHLLREIHDTGRGMVFIERTRLSSPGADLSVEPDVLVVLVETLESGRARLVPKSTGDDERFVEIEGAADLVVECVSDSSVVKDRDWLRERYHRAGVREYWIADARKPAIDFQLLLHRPAKFELSAPDGDGFARSEVLSHSVRLVRRSRAAGLVFFRLEMR
jgi:Uma2 family endonuclease